MKTAETRDRTGDLQIFSLTLSQLSYRGLQNLNNLVSYSISMEYPVLATKTLAFVLCLIPALLLSAAEHCLGIHLQVKHKMRRYQIRCSIVVSISACHAEDPGSIPGGGVCAS